MSGAYHQLLDAAIQHLEELKARGVRHVPVALETLAALSEPPRPTSVQRPFTPSGAERVPGTGGSRSTSPPPSPAPKGTLSPSEGERDGVRGRSVEPGSTQKAPPSAIEQTLALSLPGEDAVAPTAAPLSPEAKQATFAALRERALACMKCPHLAAARKNVVFGVGSLDAELMFIG